MKSREISFRLWDKCKKEWNEYLILGLDGVLLRNECCSEPNYENFILEQFTGLRDGAGKDIYEGDILLFRGNKVIVHWDYYYLNQYSLYPIEIIGNIHENPELVR